MFSLTLPLMLRLLSNVTYPGHARLATDRRLLESDNWNCGCDGANRDEHLTLEPRDPPPRNAPKLY